MTVYYITFRSVTFAQRAERLLKQNGIRCSIRRTPRWMEDQGCGYYLQVRQVDVDTALDLIQEHRIAYKKLYVKAEGCEIQEVEL